MSVNVTNLHFVTICKNKVFLVKLRPSRPSRQPHQQTTTTEPETL